jgi:predicted ferric reductase
MNELLWYLSRATGIVSIVALTATFCLGMLTSGRRSRRGINATVVMGLHRNLSLLMVVFLSVHVLTAIVETYVSIDLISLVVPFTAGYEPVWVGLGTLAFDVLVAVMVSSALRHRMSERLWRVVHLFAYALWPLALVHGLAMGTPSMWGLRATTIACGGVGAGAVVWRLMSKPADAEVRTAVAAQGWR